VDYTVEVGWVHFVVDGKVLDQFVTMMRGAVVKREYLDGRYVTYRPERAEQINIAVLDADDEILSYRGFQELKATEKAKQEALKASSSEEAA